MALLHLWHQDYAFSGTDSGRHVPGPELNCAFCWYLLWLMLSHPLTLQILWRTQWYGHGKWTTVGIHHLLPSFYLCVLACTTHMWNHCYSAVARDLFWAWCFSPAADPVALYAHLSFLACAARHVSSSVWCFTEHSVTQRVTHRLQGEDLPASPEGQEQRQGSCGQSLLLPPEKPWTLWSCFWPFFSLSSKETTKRHPGAPLVMWLIWPI